MGCFIQKCLLVLLFGLCCYSAEAQKIKTSQNTTTQDAALTPDTSKAVINPKHVKVRIVGGGRMTSANDVVENITKSKENTTFINCVNTCSLSETLKSRGPLTVFVPTDEAFKALARGVLDTLRKPSHKVDMTRLLTNHVIVGHYTTKDIAKKIKASKTKEAVFITLTGSKLKAKVNVDGNITLIDETGNEVTISIPDIEQSNGIIHIVTAVLIPKTK